MEEGRKRRRRKEKEEKEDENENNVSRLMQKKVKYFIYRVGQKYIYSCLYRKYTIINK